MYCILLLPRPIHYQLLGILDFLSILKRSLPRGNRKSVYDPLTKRLPTVKKVIRSHTFTTDDQVTLATITTSLFITKRNKAITLYCLKGRGILIFYYLRPSDLTSLM